jgi:Na+/proline symporter
MISASPSTSPPITCSGASTVTWTSLNGLHSQPDFFVRKYASPSLGVLVSIVDLVALIPYLVLQLAVSAVSRPRTVSADAI